MQEALIVEMSLRGRADNCQRDSPKCNFDLHAHAMPTNAIREEFNEHYE